MFKRARNETYSSDYNFSHILIYDCFIVKYFMELTINYISCHWNCVDENKLLERNLLIKVFSSVVFHFNK